MKFVINSHGKETATMGHTKKVNGRDATIELRGTPGRGKIQSIHTFGKGDPTKAEEQRADIILKALQQSNRLVQ
jgi:regulator of nonsense transcripts 1